MADAPSGGGNAWTAIEIILVIILVIALISKITGTPITPVFDASAPHAAKSDDTTHHADCGLTVVEPRTNEAVSGGLVLSGSVAGCNWHPVDSIALSAEVIDQSGLPLSDYTNVPVNSMNGSVASFATTIMFKAAPRTSTGTLMLIPAGTHATPESAFSVRIPITFAHIGH